MPDPTVTGLDAWLQYLTDQPKKMQHGLGIGLQAGAQLIEATAKANCPVHLGELRESIHTTVKESGSNVVAKIVAGGKAPDGTQIAYAHLIEFSGAAPHLITGKNGGPVSFGGRTFKAIHHPGMQAKPFLRPAMDANEVAAIGLVDQQIENVIQDTR
jgi:HK97 gp10 family phage protein